MHMYASTLAETTLDSSTSIYSFNIKVCEIVPNQRSNVESTTDGDALDSLVDNNPSELIILGPLRALGQGSGGGTECLVSSALLHSLLLTMQM